MLDLGDHFISFDLRSSNPHNELKIGDTFDLDVANIFSKLTHIAKLKSLPQQKQINAAASPQKVYLTKIQSFILKYSVTLMPILIESKRYPMQRIR
jgi:hypothetical protein